MNLTYLSPVANHLWQSTMFAGIAALLTLTLRRNSGRVRYWVWLAASCKFLIPLSLLMTLGAHIQWQPAPKIARANVAVVMMEVSQPFTPLLESAPSRVPVPAPANHLTAVLCGIWACGFLGITVSWWVRWRRFRTAISRGKPIPLELPLPVVCAPTPIEPGVFGILRPVLLLPEGTFERLIPAQLEAIIAHELSHVRHRDNLIAAIHMFVETVFWFYPLVWWIGKRMVEERERACDEEVLTLGSEPRVYADGILNVCKLYLESPLICVSGVTGSNLKRRIEAIMSNTVALKLNFGKKAIMAAAGAATLVLPVVIGMMNTRAVLAQAPASANTQKFEVASIKACAPGPPVPKTKGPGGGGGRPSSSPGRYQSPCDTVMDLIRTAYGGFVPISGGPAWIKSDRYQIEAKAEAGTSPRIMGGPMLQSLLADRFQLKIHHETREVPVYALTVAKGGFKLQPSKEGSCIAPGDIGAHLEPGQKPCGIPMTRVTGPNMIMEIEGSVDQFCKVIGVSMGRPVINKTGITGVFDLRLEFARDEAIVAGAGDRGPASDDSTAPSILTAVQQQLGLKLESTKGPGETLIVESIERPSEN